MHVHELPLVAFTVLSQMAVGAFVVLGVVHTAARRRHDVATVDRLSDPALLAIGPVMVAGLAASVVHLGNPGNALNVLGNLGSSWLSREVLLGCAFTGLGAAFAVCQLRRWFTPALRQALAAVTAVVGIGLVAATAQVYLIPTVPAWDSWATPVAFGATTVLLGTLAVALAFVATPLVRRRRAADPAPEPDPAVDALVRGTLRWAGLVALAVVAVQLVAMPLWLLELATATDGTAVASAGALSALTVGGGFWIAARLVLAVLGAGVLGLFLRRLAVAGSERLLLATAGSALLLALVAEVLGRFLFFSSYTRVGI
jgi:anaerobic dimethyl sulfoxide reductase subunit C (anchor subunit)